MTRKVGKPYTVDKDTEIWVVENNFQPILIILREFLPHNLWFLMHKILSEEWLSQRNSRTKSEILREQKTTCHAGFEAKACHYSAHSAYRDEYYLYRGVKLDLLMASMPMWEWSEEVVCTLLPQSYEEVQKRDILA